MSSSEAVNDRVFRVLRESLYVAPLTAEDDLVDAGLVDSAGFMELFLALEDEFGIRITQEDLDLDFFRTVERIVAFVVGKQQAQLGQS